MKNRFLLILLPLLFSLSSCNFSPSKNDDSSEKNNDNNGENKGNDGDKKDDITEHDPMKITEDYEKVDTTKLIKWDEAQSSLRSGTKTLDFYNLNDTHGATENVESSNEPGISKLSTFLKNKKTENKDGFIFTSTGDMWQGSADSNITRGRLVTEWMNHLECSAMALGNHEFDWELNTIVKNDKMANFDYLACNIIDTKTNKEVDWVKPFTTETKNGVNIGYIGAIGEGITSSILASNVKGLKFDKIDNYVTKWSSYLKENGADVVVLLLHDEVSKAADLVSKNVVDAVFCGHTHTVENLYRNGVYSIQAGSNGQYVGHISLNYDFSSKTVSSLKGEVIGMSDYFLEKDQATEDIYQKYLVNEINAVKNEVVGYTSTKLSKSKVIELLLKYMYKYYQDEIHEPNIDIFRVTHNNARSEIPAGNITYGAIYKALPFDNYLSIIKKKGSKFSYDDYGTHYYPNGSSTDPNKYYYCLTMNYISEYEHTDDDYTIEKNYLDVFMRDIFKKYVGNDYPKK